MRKALYILLLLSVTTTGAFGQGALPPGKWWRQPRVVQHLGLTDEQQARLDLVFRENAAELIDLKADVEKRSLALRNELDQPQVNRQAVQRVAASLSQARARLFEREVMMFVEMRGVLSADQWSRFRQVLDARERMHQPKRRGRGDMAPRKVPPQRRP